MVVSWIPNVTTLAIVSGMIVSFHVLFRYFWSKWKNPRMPPPGEAWCVKCSLNGGKTRIVSPGGLRHHIDQHPPKDIIDLRASWRTTSQEKQGL